MTKPETRPMTDLESRLWREHGLTQAQLLALASVLAGDDKGETQDHARWTPALDAARKLIAERDALREALRELDAATNASFPAYESTAQAQTAWGDRIYNARQRARALLEEAT